MKPMGVSQKMTTADKGGKGVQNIMKIPHFMMLKSVCYKIVIDDKVFD